MTFTAQLEIGREEEKLGITRDWVRERKRRHSERKSWYVSSLRSTVEGSGSPFADELHYLWASRGNKAGAADATRVGPTPPPATERYRGAYWATIYKQTPSMAYPRRTLTLLASWSVA